jgi:hypothetical protein
MPVKAQATVGAGDGSRLMVAGVATAILVQVRRRAV